jgi:hypothetical protein
LQEEYAQRRESAKANTRLGAENATVAFSIRNVFEDKPKFKPAKVDPELELLERGKLEIQHF